MRIAVLPPISFSTSPKNPGPSAEDVLRLVNGLAAAGVDVTLFAASRTETQAKVFETCPGPVEPGDGPASDVWEYLHISRAFEQAGQFDLIHNHLGYPALGFSGLVETPLLTTIYGEPPGETLPIYRKYNDRVFYVSTRDADRKPGLHYVAAIDPKGGDMVAGYIRLYEDIVKKTAREDHRPWGFYEVFSGREDHKVKRITVYPGKRLSYQRHRRRSEHWHIVDGEAVVTLDGEDIPLSGGESIDIPCGGAHRIANPGEKNVVFIEVQKGDYFGEDDIERLEDDFGRS